MQKNYLTKSEKISNFLEEFSDILTNVLHLKMMVFDIENFH